jgi:hypothetical protein
MASSSPTRTPGHQPGVLEHGADQAVGHRLRRRPVIHPHLAPVGLQQAEQQADGGALPGSVGPQQGNRFPRRDMQVKAGQRPRAPI